MYDSLIFEDPETPVDHMALVETCEHFLVCEHCQENLAGLVDLSTEIVRDEVRRMLKALAN